VLPKKLETELIIVPKTLFNVSVPFAKYTKMLKPKKAKTNIINIQVVGLIFWNHSENPDPLLDTSEDVVLDDKISGISGIELLLDCKIVFDKLLEELIIIKIHILFYYNSRII
jgi:hypothetical protein